MATSTYRGHVIIYDHNDDQWTYWDTQKPIPPFGEERPCLHCCHTHSEDDDHDYCLGILPGVKSACCGHGDHSKSFVIFDSGVELRGFQVKINNNDADKD